MWKYDGIYIQYTCDAHFESLSPSHPDHLYSVDPLYQDLGVSEVISLDRLLRLGKLYRDT